VTYCIHTHQVCMHINIYMCVYNTKIFIFFTFYYCLIIATQGCTLYSSYYYILHLPQRLVPKRIDISKKHLTSLISVEQPAHYHHLEVIFCRRFSDERCMRREA
jgi:hypothetical protein